MNAMHPDEVAIDLAGVRALLDDQFPAWSGLRLERIESGGTDNTIYRLGDDLAARLPRTPGAAQNVAKEARWLPVLAPQLPLPVPLPVAMGRPTAAYPLSWSVCRWLQGRDALTSPPTDLRRVAHDIAGFVTALQAIDTAGGPVSDAAHPGRGAPLVTRDAEMRAALARSEGLFDVAAAHSLWVEALAAPIWDKPGRWLHGDLHPANMLVADGRIAAIIDWGSMAVGDPACELIVAWSLLDEAGRQVLREALDIEAAMWRRGRGWAVSMAVIALPYYINTNPVLVGVARRMLAELLGPGAVPQ